MIGRIKDTSLVCADCGTFFGEKESLGFWRQKVVSRKCYYLCPEHPYQTIHLCPECFPKYMLMALPNGIDVYDPDYEDKK